MGKFSSFYNRRLKHYMPQSIDNYISRYINKESDANMLPPFSSPPEYSFNELDLQKKVSALEQKVEDLSELSKSLTDLANTQLKLYQNLERRLQVLVEIVSEDEKSLKTIMDVQKAIIEVFETQYLKKDPGKNGDMN